MPSILVIGAAMVLPLSGCATDRQRLIETEFADVSRNSGLPEARLVPDPHRRKLLVLEGVKILDRDDGQAWRDQRDKLNCIRHWARERDLLVSTTGPSPGPPPNICAPGAVPPVPASFGPRGMQAQYSFVTQDALRAEMKTFLAKAKAQRFGIFLLTVNIDGWDTVFVPGRWALRSPEGARLEWNAICKLQTGPRIYPTHVRYNDVADPEQTNRVH